MVVDVDCAVVEACRKLGFHWVEIDVDDFRYVAVLYSSLETPFFTVCAYYRKVLPVQA